MSRCQCRKYETLRPRKAEVGGFFSNAYTYYSTLSFLFPSFPLFSLQRRFSLFFFFFFALLRCPMICLIEPSPSRPTARDKKGHRTTKSRTTSAPKPLPPKRHAQLDNQILKHEQNCRSRAPSALLAVPLSHFTPPYLYVQCVLSASNFIYDQVSCSGNPSTYYNGPTCMPVS